MPSVLAARKALRHQQPDRTDWLRIGETLRAAATRPTQPTRQPAPGPRPHMRAGDLALARADTDRAVACFRQAVALAPDDCDALQGLAIALAAAGRHQEAVPVYTKLTTLRPADATARYNLAVALCRLERFGEAERLYRELLADNEGFVQARYNLATLYQAQGRLGEARSAWREVVSRSPGLASAYANLGEVLTDLSEHRQAMLAFAEAAKLSQDATSWLNLAASARAAGSYGRAIAATKRALALTPDDAEVWARLGHLLYEVHRGTGRRPLLAEAIEAWKKSLHLDAEQPQLRKALRAAEQALGVSPQTQPAGDAARPGRGKLSKGAIR